MLQWNSANLDWFWKVLNLAQHNGVTATADESEKLTCQTEGRHRFSADNLLWKAF